MFSVIILQSINLTYYLFCIVEILLCVLFSRKKKLINIFAIKLKMPYDIWNAELKTIQRNQKLKKEN